MIPPGIAHHGNAARLPRSLKKPPPAASSCSENQATATMASHAFTNGVRGCGRSSEGGAGATGGGTAGWGGGGPHAGGTDAGGACSGGRKSGTPVTGPRPARR